MNIIEKLNKQKEYSPDLQIRKISFLFNKLYIINIQSVSSSKQVNSFILKYFSNISIFKKALLFKDITKYIPSISFININENDVNNYLYNGFCILIFNKKILAFEMKENLDRSISEPTSEPSIKGPKDSFNENYNTNIGLVRKRIKDDNLYLKELMIGSVTKTRVCLMYLENKVDKSLLSNVIEKISSIKTDAILDTYYIKKLLKEENNYIIPTIKSTEKPSLISYYLLKGKICLIIENSNSALIIPTYFIDYFFNDEDNYQKEIFSKFSKIIRIIALLITIFLPSIYLSLISYDEQMLPTDLLLSFSSQRANVPFPVFIEALILLLTFELLYEADKITPIKGGASLSILGALVLGDAAVSAGIVSPIMVIVVAISSICSIFFIYQDFQAFIRIYRYILMILSSIFGLIGIVFGFLFLLTNLSSIKTFNKTFFIS